MDKLVSQTVRRTPIIAPPRPAELPQPGRFADGKSVQPVLIVIEKDHELADAIVDMGERRGYIGTGVPDISLAKQMLGGLGKNQPHLIIADKNPETDPRELGDLFSAVKTANPNSKTIVFATMARDIPVDERDKIRADTYIDKPHTDLLNAKIPDGQSLNRQVE